MFNGTEVPIKSIEGWVILVTGIHEEAQEEDVREAFENYGTVTNLHLNLDRRTGYVKGYALLEFKNRNEAESAITNLNGSHLLGKQISVSWVFRESPQV
uniref:RNA-binding protein, putative n=1 Tax=Theileria annulata TaxID=5874 RepID=A0A3B0N1V8_THEAN